MSMEPLREEQRRYLTEQYSIILGYPVQPNDDQIARGWHQLTRTEEHEGPRDQHGNFPPEASTLAELSLLEAPPLHADLAVLAAGQAPVPRWPKGHRFAACLTHDVDRIVQYPWRERLRQMQVCRRSVNLLQQVRWLLGAGLHAVLEAGWMSDLAPYDAWVTEERRFGYHSTFFVLPEYLAAPTLHDHYYRYADQVMYQGIIMPFAEATQRLADAGWEIGLHGSYAGALDAAMLHEERRRLEGITRRPVSSIRQHYLRFDIDRSPRAQAAAGFSADSTLGYSSVIGCRAGLAFPFFWQGLDLLEAPLLMQDVALLRGSRGHLAEAIARARTLITRVAECGGMVTLSWHTHPQAPGAAEAYRVLLETIAALDGWGCSLGELDAWWRARRALVRSEKTGVGSQEAGDRRYPASDMSPGGTPPG